MIHKYKIFIYEMSDNDFKCPITLQIFREPVLASDGKFYEREVIENHIKLFHLNSPERRNREVSLYCKNVINQKSLLLDVRYNNYIVDLFEFNFS